MVFGINAGFCGVQGSRTSAHSSLAMGPRALDNDSSLKNHGSVSEWEAEAADSPAQCIIMLPEAASGPAADTVSHPCPRQLPGGLTLHTCPGWFRKASSVFLRNLRSFMYSFEVGDWEYPGETELTSGAVGGPLATSFGVSLLLPPPSVPTPNGSLISSAVHSLPAN